MGSGSFDFVRLLFCNAKELNIKHHVYVNLIATERRWGGPYGHMSTSYFQGGKKKISVHRSASEGNSTLLCIPWRVSEVAQ